MRYLLGLLLLAYPGIAAEEAAYDSNGRIIAMLPDSEDVAVSSDVVAVLPNGKRVRLQTRQPGAGSPGAVRQGSALAWSLVFELPDGGRGRLELKSDEDTSGVHFATTVTAQQTLNVSAIEFVIDLPRDSFVNGRAAPEGAALVALDAVRAAGPVLFDGRTTTVRFQDAPGTLGLDVAFGQPRSTRLVDRWDARGRSFQLRAAIAAGTLTGGASRSLTATLRLTDSRPAPPPVRLTLDASRARYHFDGFGANYCWNNSSPIAAYTLENLKIAWARSELKLVQWDEQRDHPGPELRADLEKWRRFHEMGVPFVVSIWWLPERFYTDPYEKPRSGHFRIIDPEKWDELLDLMGSYLLYAKREYGAEPDLFSFNEANRGVYVGLTPETHTQAIKRIGAYFRKIGLKTKMLLGDTTGMRDTHLFALDAAADAEAMQYVGAVAFHSWGGATPQQYAVWGDLAEWLHLPLLVTELGLDGAGYYTRTWDSYDYGLRESSMAQEILLYARPQGTQYWQFTQDFALARVGRDGVVQPTARFWLMKHFTDLTPHGSDVLSTGSGQASVLFTAFRKGASYTLHIVNLGAARTANLEGLPDAEWQITETTEAAQYRNTGTLRSNESRLALKLPSRSFVSLTGRAQPGGSQ
jgi:hypothetical protein